MEIITIGQLKDANVVDIIMESATDNEQAEELFFMTDLYTEVSNDGKFEVKKVSPFNIADVMEFETVEPWPYLKRRILYNCLKKAMEPNKIVGVIMRVYYEFDKGLHVTGISDSNIMSIQLSFDYGYSLEAKPLRFVVYLKK
jgi:hypothetical protein